MDMMKESEKLRKQFEREMAEKAVDCDWHSHSMFNRCRNGLTLRGYLNRPTVNAEVLGEKQ
jgi:hypothetical protein